MTPNNPSINDEKGEEEKKSPVFAPHEHPFHRALMDIVLWPKTIHTLQDNEWQEQYYRNAAGEVTLELLRGNYHTKSTMPLWYKGKLTEEGKRILQKHIRPILEARVGRCPMLTTRDDIRTFILLGPPQIRSWIGTSKFEAWLDQHAIPEGERSPYWDPDYKGDFSLWPLTDDAAASDALQRKSRREIDQIQRLLNAAPRPRTAARVFAQLEYSLPALQMAAASVQHLKQTWGQIQNDLENLDASPKFPATDPGLFRFTRYLLTRVDEAQKQVILQLGGLPRLQYYDLPTLQSVWECNTQPQADDHLEFLQNLTILNEYAAEQWTIHPATWEAIRHEFSRQPEDFRQRAADWWKRRLSGSDPDLRAAFARRLAQNKVPIYRAINLSDAIQRRKRIGIHKSPLKAVPGTLLKHLLAPRSYDSDWEGVEKNSPLLSPDEYLYARFLQQQLLPAFGRDVLLTLIPITLAILSWAYLSGGVRTLAVLLFALAAGITFFYTVVARGYHLDAAWGDLWEEIRNRQSADN